MTEINVTATEFQKNVGTFLDKASLQPVQITKHGRPSRVLVNAEVFAQLQEFVRQHRGKPVNREMTDEEAEMLRSADMGPRDQHLDYLMR